jgi:hypothetical protein
MLLLLLRLLLVRPMWLLLLPDVPADAERSKLLNRSKRAALDTESLHRS